MRLARINPTRSELLKLKKRIKLAERGHKLLKEKRDGLMVQFIKLINQSKEHRGDLDQRLDRAFTSLAISRSLMRTGDLEYLFSGPSGNRGVDMKTKYVMSTKVPLFSLRKEKPRKNYGFYGVPAEVDSMCGEFNSVLESLARLAETEKAIKLLAQDLEKTRRRVNALEHIIIPNLKETAKSIKMKLDEMERSSFSNLRIIKGMIEAREEKERLEAMESRTGKKRKKTKTEKTNKKAKKPGKKTKSKKTARKKVKSSSKKPKKKTGKRKKTKKKS